MLCPHPVVFVSLYCVLYFTNMLREGSFGTIVVPKSPCNGCFPKYLLTAPLFDSNDHTGMGYEW